MKRIFKLAILIGSLQLGLSCQNTAKESANAEQLETQREVNSSKIDAKALCKELCADFPNELVTTNYKGSKKIEKEQMSFGTCKLKLFYGEKDYEYWEGELSVWVNQQKDPFWQYNPDRNSALYQEVKGIGERAVYITNMYQLLILKDGVMYSIAPPNNGSITDTGKEIKDIAIEIATYYQL